LEAEPKIEEHFEWLAHRVAEMDLAAGITHDYDEAYLRGLLPVLMRSHLDDIRTEEQMLRSSSSQGRLSRRPEAALSSSPQVNHRRVA
jgi:hypothetical protein